MRLTIRMIGLATTFFWIFLAAFLASAAYSIKDLQFNFGEPQMTVTSENELIFHLPINMANRGYYAIGAFNVTTRISDSEGNIIANGSTFVPSIERGETLMTSHNVTLEIDELLRHSDYYLFNDSQLEAAVFAGMKLAELVPVRVSTNLSVPWGAPFYNFTLGELNCERFNRTHLQVTAPINFENHAFFDIVGNMNVRLYNSSNALIGESQVSFDVPQYASYNGNIEFYVRIASFTPNGRFDVYFSTPFFDYGPVVVPYG